MNLQESRQRNVFSMFPTGYVLELERGRYFSDIKKGRICCRSLDEARYFRTLEEAELFSEKHLGYHGLQIQLCYVCWTLVETESLEQVWRFITDQAGGTVKFAGYQEAERYRRKKKLQNNTMVERYAFRVKELFSAA